MIDIRHGDSRDVLKTLADNSIDSVVTDPPYALVSIGKRFGKEGSAPAKSGKTGAYARASAGFMGQEWDTGETAFAVEFWTEVYRVLKPGGHVIAFGGTRTYHRLACAVEDAGFEIRDMVSWLYGTGFPKSHSVAVGIDKAAGVAPRSRAFNMKGRGGRAEELDSNGREFLPPYSPTTPEAKLWKGWGTALKPACEPCVLARKPLEGTVAQNVLKWGTGALYIDGCRIDTDESLNGGAYAEAGNRDISGSLSASGMNRAGATTGLEFAQPPGRWPSNVIHDGSDQVLAAFPDAMGQQGALTGNEPSAPMGHGGIYGTMARVGSYEPRDDAGSAARFFYSAKADATERLGTAHPTVKPTDVMAYMTRLITPPRGTVLDPFAGSGSTGVAAVFEGFDCILIEREAKFVEDARRRVAWAQGRGGLTMTEKKRPKEKPSTGADRSLF